MAKRILSKDEYMQMIFKSSDEDEPATVTFEADSVHDDLHDALTWQAGGGGSPIFDC